jgi:4-amino-4-deoxy-L-arabinose transferase-like glycosyltransferase
VRDDALDRAPRGLLAAIVAAAAILRIYPVWFGLPYLNARPDESTSIAHAVEVMRGSFNPHFFHWPSLTFYLFGLALRAVSDVMGAVSPDAVLSDAGRLLVTRTCVALAGTATILVVYDLGRRLVDRATGLAAAAFLTVAVLHVRESHFAMTDVLMTCLVTASLMLLVRALHAGEAASGRLGQFAAAGLVSGLAASTKYSAAAIVVSMAAIQAVWFVQSPRRAIDPRAWAPSVLFLIAFAAGFVVATPYAVLDHATFSADLRFDFTHLSAGHVVNVGRGWWYHLTRTLPYGVGVLPCLAAAAGIVLTGWRHGVAGIAVVSFAIAFYASIGSGLAVFFRYALPLVPLVCLFAAVGVRYFASSLAARARLSPGAAMTIVTVVVAAWPAVSSVWFDVVLGRTDSRVLAADWLRARVRPEETMAEAGGLYAELDLSGASFHRWSFDPANGSFGVPDGGAPDWLVLAESPLWSYASVPQELRRLAAERYTLQHEVIAAWDDGAVYDLQDAFFMPVAGFASVERPGPNVRIFRRRDLPPVR